MGAILLTVVTVLLGYGLGKGVPRLVQGSGRLARRFRFSQLAFGCLLLLPWLPLCRARPVAALVLQLPALPPLHSFYASPRQPLPQPPAARVG